MENIIEAWNNNMAREEEIDNAKPHFIKEYLKMIITMTQETVLKKVLNGQMNILNHLG